MSSKLFAARGALAKGAWARGLSRDGRAALVGDATTLRLFGAQATSALRKAAIRASVFTLPEGEAAKSWPSVERLMGAMLDSGLGRGAAVVALGGGAVTDAAGFAASIYLRGLPWVSVPTTVLGQLDGGLGGKTAINLKHGKNLAGSFHDPVAVVCDPLTLKTLPRRERISGLAEAVKTAWLFDPALWRYMRERWDALAEGDQAALERVVAACAKWKLKVVAEDPHETTGRRELLNLGHTLGHALEKAAGYGALRHGEAVIWGLRAMLRLSLKRAGLSLSAAMELEDFLAGLPVPEPRVSASEILAAAKRDKKAREGRLRFILLKAVGRPATVDGITEAEAAAVVEELL